MGTGIAHVPGPVLRGLVRRITGFEDSAAGHLALQPAEIVYPVIVAFGAPFRIALGTGPVETRASFAAGLFAGPVSIATTGPVACVQADLSPEGAARLFGGAVPALSGQMVSLDDLWPREAADLADRLAEAPGWPERLVLMEGFLAPRLLAGQGLAPEIAFAWRCLAATHGRARIGAIAARTGWSRTRLSGRFRAGIGLSPKGVGRILRLQRATALGRTGLGWAEIAAEAGYADQSHLTRDFTALAGRPPEHWRRDRPA
jgi:AraC-like DNA-binding protein